MKESITIRNFGPLLDIQIDDIKPFTLLIGESASGKSTLIKVITLFRYISKMLHIRSFLKHANISKSPFKLSFQTYLKMDSLDKMVTSDTEIVYAFGATGKEYSITYKNKKLQFNFQSISKQDLVFQKISFLPETRNIIPAWADRGARLAGGYLGFYFHEAYNDFEEATNTIDQLDLGYVNQHFSVRRKNNRKEFFIKPLNDDHLPVSLKDASSGIQTSAPLTVVSSYFSKHFDFNDAFKRSVISYLFDNQRIKDFKPIADLADMEKIIHLHVEEPELSLFPDAQCHLLNYLVNQCFVSNKPDRTLSLMIATHSPYLLNQVNVLLRAGFYNKEVEGAYLKGNEVAVYRLFEGKLQPLQSTFGKEQEPVINTIDLSESMNEIYDIYQTLKH
jgi:predicted ATPase